MFDFDVGKLLVFGIVALAVIPPKDLPRVMRTVGQALGKMRRMATEFQGQFKEAMREADLESIKTELDGVKKHFGDIKDGVKKEVASLEQAAKIDASFDPAMAIHSELSHTGEPPKEVGLSEVSLSANPPASAEIGPLMVPIAPKALEAKTDLAEAASAETAPADATAPRDAAE
jgi:sec-independent protein translocase protein TatB